MSTQQESAKNVKKTLLPPICLTDIRINSARVSLGLISCLAATRYARYLLPRYTSAPVWHMGLAAWVAGTGITGLGYTGSISIPYSNNIDTDIFFISLYAKRHFLHLLRPVYL